MKTDFKYTKVVRKKEERAKMAASSCPSCYRYYKASGLDDEEIAKLIGQNLWICRVLLGSVICSNQLLAFIIIYTVFYENTRYTVYKNIVNNSQSVFLQ